MDVGGAIAILIWGIAIGIGLHSHAVRRRPLSISEKMGAQVARMMEEAVDKLRFAPNSVVTLQAMADLPNGNRIKLEVAADRPLASRQTIGGL